jgi:hypothetical protein
MKTRFPVLALLAFLTAAPWLQAQDNCDGQSEPRTCVGRCLRRFCDRLERKSCGYGKTHHDFGCTGLKGECIFLFGSCWQFFEEPCNRQPVPPHPLLPGHAGRHLATHPIDY